MSKMLKYFLYVIICVAIFFAFVKIFGGPFSPDSASAFEWEKQVNVYFGNKNMGSPEDCSKVFPVSRTILNAETFGPGALEALLKGVSVKEKESGYFTSLNDNILLQRFEIKNGVAYVDFNSRFNEGMGGSCRVTAIKSQIENTLSNLPDIDTVVISVNGQTEGILEP
ncbi:MAG: GerMN domain-containing protein [Candidatus Zambryskibacteria bacterium]